ncbi:MAG: hypothetical protein U5N58_06085 [Actinomycetota bacterium]|nr:hypothetical protein [Actinomycetota bacterium]
MKKMIKDTGRLNVIVSDSHTKKDGDEMAQRIEEMFSPKEIMRAEIGPVVGNHLFLG